MEEVNNENENENNNNNDNDKDEEFPVKKGRRPLNDRLWISLQITVLLIIII